MFTLEESDPVLYACEPIYRNGEPVGEISSGAYGHKLGCAVGMGYVRKAEGTIDDPWILSGEYTIEIEDRLLPAAVHIKSPYDPDNRRVRM